MKLLKSLLSVAFLSSVALSAMNIDTGKEFPGNGGGTGFRTIELIQQATNKLVELRKWITNQQEARFTMKFPSKEASVKYSKRIEIHVKGALNEVKELINKAEKEAHSL